MGVSGDGSGSAPNKRAILVAGGGIGGLGAAIALAQTGWQVEVLEQRAPGHEDGAGIQVGPNGVHALGALGVADLLRPYVAEPKEISVREGRTARVLARLPLAPWMRQRHGAPYWVMRRADLHGALAARAGAISAIRIRHGFKITRVEQDAERVTIAAVDGASATGAALIGADGLWSVVARQGLGTRAPQFTGRTAARVVLPMTVLPPAFTQLATGLWLGPRSHLVHYPVDAGRGVNFVAVVEGGGASDDWGAPIDRAPLEAAFGDWCGEVRSLLRIEGSWRRWSLMERPPLDTWSKGRIAVLGDAAHPILPFLAQGAVLALEDALVLADCMSAARDDIPTAFVRYGGRRAARARRVVEASRRNGRIYHLSGVGATARDAAMRWLPPERLIAGYDWLYGFRDPALTALPSTAAS